MGLVKLIVCRTIPADVLENCRVVVSSVNIQYIVEQLINKFQITARVQTPSAFSEDIEFVGSRNQVTMTRDSLEWPISTGFTAHVVAPTIVW